MKITRKHLRSIIKEELGRLFEQDISHTDEDGKLVFDTIDIEADSNSIDIVGDPNADPAALDLAGRLHDAANELDFGYGDPLDSLASQLMAGTMDVETGNDAALTAFDMLARLDNASTIGVEAAVEAFGL
mgnify:CR=1 FL=1